MAESKDVIKGALNMENSALAKRPLGHTNFQVTPIGLGGAHLGRTSDGFSDELAIATVHCALESGINLIDTSPYYGQSQRRIGIALEQWYKKGGRREDLIISTKTGHCPDESRDYTADSIRRSVEESLRLLHTDYLDILLVHDPNDLAEVLGPGGALETLRKFKAQGIIRSIGLGAQSHEFHRRCIETGEFDVLLTAGNYTLIEQSAAKGILEPAATHDIGVLNGTALLLGLLSGSDPRKSVPVVLMGDEKEKAQRAYKLWEWAQSRGVSLLALNLQFCLRERRIASTLLGVANPEQLETDIAAISEKVSDNIWSELYERFNFS